MKKIFGLTDLAMAILFPELTILQSSISKLGTTRLGKRMMLKNARAAFATLPAIKLTTPDLKQLQDKIAKLVDPTGTIESAQTAMLLEPGKLGKNFGTLTKEEKIALSDEFANFFEIGVPDASTLSSSAVSFGIYTPTSQSSGNLELTFINGGTYTYPGVPLGVWTEMTAATGKNGSGAYTIFYYGYWRAASGTKGARQISTAFRLAGIGR